MGVEKRRRKKARIQADSSDSESESASSAAELSGYSESDSEPEGEQELEPKSNSESQDTKTQTPRERLHKLPQNHEADFTQFYLKLVTEQFGDDLAALRQANDFTNASIAQLVAGLKQGVDIFSPDQQEILANEQPNQLE